MVYGVILAGGRGERFWPLSRLGRPKQFLRLVSNQTMLQETINRVLPVIPLENIRVVTGESMADLVTQFMPQVTSRHLLTEPVGRSTCGAVGLAAIHLAAQDPEAVMVVLSADHLIRPAEKLLEILRQSTALAAEDDCLITIGILPTRAETGYGYICVGDKVETPGVSPVYHVSAFTEKPQQAVAKQYYLSGQYLWNSGMFVWSARAFLKAVEQCQPEMYRHLTDYAAAVGSEAEASARMRLYEVLPSISVDVAVLERANNVIVVKADLMWDDIGDWNAMARYHDRDSDNNVCLGPAAVLQSYETTILNEAPGLVACVGVSDLIVVRCEDVTLVLHKTRTQHIKELLSKLAEDEDGQKFL